MLCYIVDGRDKPVVGGHSQYDNLDWYTQLIQIKHVN